MANKSKRTEAGVDVGKELLDASARRDGGRIETAQFTNDANGHRKLCAWLTKRGRSARVVLESTGTYSLDVALALYRARGIEVMVANPRLVKNFADALLQRSKTDKISAEVMREFCERMEFVAWRPPSNEVLKLRALARRISTLSDQHAAEINRLHAVRASSEAVGEVVNDIEVNLRHLDRRMELLKGEALALVASVPELERALRHVISVRGFAEASAIQLLAELLVLPADMSARQWVAHAGLDVRSYQSGSSVQYRPRISKVGNSRIRRALYMPALVAVRHEPSVQGFFETLTARGKKPMVAYVAVMRKLLHAIYGMLKNNQDFVGEKFCARALKAA
jgi:transposase